MRHNKIALLIQYGFEQIIQQYNSVKIILLGSAVFIGEVMRKQRNQYISSLDALVAVLKRLSIFEDRYHLESEEFFDKFRKGLLEDSADFVDWSNDYQHYVAIRFEIESQIRNVA